jgi:hypothetical protein
MSLNREYCTLCRRLRNLSFSNVGPNYKYVTPCILNFIFLVCHKPNEKMRPSSPLQGGGGRRSRERAPLAGLVALRPGARSAFARWSKLEPLPERFGLQPWRLVSEQV